MSNHQPEQAFQTLEVKSKSNSSRSSSRSSDSNQIVTSNHFGPKFPLSRSRAGKLLGKSDVSVGKWLIRLSEVYINNSKLQLLENNKITEEGFNQLVLLQRATSPEIPDYDSETGAILWNAEGIPVKMIENPERVSLSRYLSKLQTELFTKHTDEIASVSGLEPAEIVPIEIDTENVINIAQINQLEANEAMNRTQDILDQSRSRYSSMRAMRRRNIAAQALRDSAEDAELYTQVYDGNMSKIISQQANGLEGNNNKS